MRNSKHHAPPAARRRSAHHPSALGKSRPLLPFARCDVDLPRPRSPWPAPSPPEERQRTPRTPQASVPRHRGSARKKPFATRWEWLLEGLSRPGDPRHKGTPVKHGSRAFLVARKQRAGPPLGVQRTPTTVLPAPVDRGKKKRTPSSDERKKPAHPPSAHRDCITCNERDQGARTPLFVERPPSARPRRGGALRDGRSSRSARARAKRRVFPTTLN